MMKNFLMFVAAMVIIVISGVWEILKRLLFNLKSHFWCWAGLSFWGFVMITMGWNQVSDRDLFILSTGAASGLALHWWCNRK